MLLSLLACTDPRPDPALPFEPAGPNAAPDPGVAGPYPVGVSTVRVDDGAGGELVVELWYPATEDARGEAGYTYTLDDVLSPVALAAEPNFDGLVLALPTTAVRDAVPRPEAFPLVLFSHGASGMRTQSTYLTVHLASHGMVVAAPDHPGSTLSDTVIAGKIDMLAMLLSFSSRTEELAAVADALESGGLGPQVDEERLAVVGHSFGALTAVRWLLVGREATAIVAQALPPLEMAAVDQMLPLNLVESAVQIQVGGIDTTTPPAYAEAYWNQLHAPRGRLDLAHAGHFTFSDMCLVDPEVIGAADAIGIGDALGDGCAPENTDPAVAHPVIRHFATAHLDRWLRDSPGEAAFLTEAEALRLAPGEATYAE